MGLRDATVDAICIATQNKNKLIIFPRNGTRIVESCLQFIVYVVTNDREKLTVAERLYKVYNFIFRTRVVSFNYSNIPYHIFLFQRFFMKED